MGPLGGRRLLRHLRGSREPEPPCAPRVARATLRSRGSPEKRPGEKALIFGNQLCFRCWKRKSWVRTPGAR